MQAKLAHVSRLPSLPTVAVQVVQAFSDPDVGVQEIAQILRTDPAITGKILQAANSSRFATGRQISDIHRALMILGKKVVSSLALSFSLAEASMNNGPHVEYFKSFWLQSVRPGTHQRTSGRVGTEYLERRSLHRRSARFGRSSGDAQGNVG